MVSVETLEKMADKEFVSLQYMFFDECLWETVDEYFQTWGRVDFNVVDIKEARIEARNWEKTKNSLDKSSLTMGLL